MNEFGAFGIQSSARAEAVLKVFSQEVINKVRIIVTRHDLRGCNEMSRFIVQIIYPGI